MTDAFQFMSRQAWPSDFWVSSICMSFIRNCIVMYNPISQQKMQRICMLSQIFARILAFIPL